MAASYYLYTKNSIVQEILHELKYKNNPEIAFLLGRWYGDDLKNIIGFSGADMIIPVPLHRSKLKKRGYNQSVFFANGLSESLKIAVHENILIRKTETETQTNKGRFDRWRNVEHKFAIADTKKLFAKHIV
ncbi:MAG TPA: hypothetical protein VNX68_03845, partial [Nitrosopumilaceae archaeon]|nr:hypothetical protein [Nitrosopumilaceae archaeon]